MSKVAYIGVGGVARKVKGGYIGIENFVNRNLPGGYTQVEYIESTGTQYIDTGLRLNQDSKLELLVSNFNETGSQKTFGSRSSATKNNFSVVSGTVSGNQAIVVDFQNYSNNRLSYVLDGDEFLEVSISKEKLKINESEKAVSTYSDFTTPGNAYLFNCSGTYPDGYTAATMRLHYCRIYDNNLLVRDFVPCYRNSDNVAGVYDLANGEFYTNVGTGAFAIGAAHSSIAHRIKRAYIGVNGVARLWLSGTVASWDVSKNKDKSVMAHLYEDENDSSKYSLVIEGTGKMKDWAVATANTEYLAEKYASKIVRATVSNGVTSVGHYAFYKLSALTDVQMADSVTSVGNYAFCGTGVQSIVFPDSVTSIGVRCLRNQKNIRSVVLPRSLVTWGAGAFDGCTSLSDVTIPDGITSIGSDAFYGCSSITSIVLPNSITTINSNAFYECAALASITLPSGVTDIGSSAFENCDSLESIRFPDTVTTVGSRAFSDCYSLTYLRFDHNSSDALTIGENAFLLTLGSSLETTVYVPYTSVHAAISGYDWVGSKRTVTYSKPAAPPPI